MHSVHLDFLIMKLHYLILFCFFFISSSCTTKDAKKNKASFYFQNKEITYSDSLKVRFKDGFKEFGNNNKNDKIIAFIDGDCGYCVQRMKLWQKYKDSLSIADSSLFLYAYGFNRILFENEYSNYNIDIPYIYDADKTLLNNNNINADTIASI